MNLIKYIGPDAEILGDVPLKYVLYFYMLSMGMEEDEIVWYSSTDDALYNKFRAYKESNVKDALDELQAEGLIKITTDGWVELGVWPSDGKVQLYTKSENPVDQFRQKISDAIDSYIEESPRNSVSRSQATALRSRFDSIHVLPVSRFTKNQFIILWEAVYEASYGEPSRPFMGKEHGQLSTLLKLYNPETVYCMISHYILNAEKYSKGAPTIGHLLACKDTIFLHMKGKKKPHSAKTHLRKATNSDF